MADNSASDTESDLSLSRSWTSFSNDDEPLFVSATGMQERKAVLAVAWALSCVGVGSVLGGAGRPLPFEDVASRAVLVRFRRVRTTFNDDDCTVGLLGAVLGSSRQQRGGGDTGLPRCCRSAASANRGFCEFVIALASPRLAASVLPATSTGFLQS